MKQTNQNPQGYFIPLPRESLAGRQYLHTTTAGAWLPLIQASITGLIVFVLALIVAMTLRTRNPWTWAGVASVATWALTWLQLQRHWFSLTRLENLTGLDLDQDGRIGGKAQPQEIRVRLSEVTAAGHFRESIYDLPGTLEQLQALAQGLAAGVPFSERNWTGSGRPFSTNEFRELRAALIRRGCLAIASPKDPRQGYVFTAAGRAVLRGIVDANSPAPGLDGLQNLDH